MTAAPRVADYIGDVAYAALVAFAASNMANVLTLERRAGGRWVGLVVTRDGTDRQIEYDDRNGVWRYCRGRGRRTS